MHVYRGCGIGRSSRGAGAGGEGIWRGPCMRGAEGCWAPRVPSSCTLGRCGGPGAAASRGGTAMVRWVRHGAAGCAAAAATMRRGGWGKVLPACCVPACMGVWWASSEARVQLAAWRAVVWSRAAAGDVKQGRVQRFCRTATDPGRGRAVERGQRLWVVGWVVEVEDATAEVGSEGDGLEVDMAVAAPRAPWST